MLTVVVTGRSVFRLLKMVMVNVLRNGARSNFGIGKRKRIDARKLGDHERRDQDTHETVDGPQPIHQPLDSGEYRATLETLGAQVNILAHLTRCEPVDGNSE